MAMTAKIGVTFERKEKNLGSFDCSIFSTADRCAGSLHVAVAE